MSLNRMSIRWKIMILSFGVVLFSILIGGITLIGNTLHSKEEELGEHALTTGRTVANLPVLQTNLQESEGWKQINPMVEKIRTVNHVDYIVVLNMNRIRFSHPVDEKLGTLSSGKDEGPSFAEHSYTTKAEGELGVAMRAFVPVMNENHEQIGVVIVGNILPSLLETLVGMKNEILFVLFLTLLFGMVGSWYLARHLKEQTYRLEPYEIVQLLVERTATFHAMNEGVMSIDHQGNVAMINKKARSILGIEADPTHQPIRQVVPESRLEETLKSGEITYNEELKIGGQLLVSTRVPVHIGEETIGAAAIFQDRTEVTQLAEELTGIKAFVDALRVQNHEHLNKMHTIAGLIQLDEKDRALDYVFETTEKQEGLSKFLIDNLKDYSLAGLLLSKVSRGSELGIQVMIDEQTELREYPLLLDKHDFVLLLGNLIENAFHSFEGVQQEEKWITISLIQTEHLCTVSVEDNGKGIPEDHQTEIFTKDYTTREKGSGFGLFLVKNIMEKGQGEAEVLSHQGDGTHIILTVPMVPEEDFYEQTANY